MKMEFALQPISENFNENGGYHGHFIKQKQLDTKAVLEEAIAMNYVFPGVAPHSVWRQYA